MEEADGVLKCGWYEAGKRPGYCEQGDEHRCIKQAIATATDAFGHRVVGAFTRYKPAAKELRANVRPGSKQQ